MTRRLSGTMLLSYYSRGASDRKLQKYEWDEHRHTPTNIHQWYCNDLITRKGDKLFAMKPDGSWTRLYEQHGRQIQKDDCRRQETGRMTISRLQGEIQVDIWSYNWTNWYLSMSMDILLVFLHVYVHTAGVSQCRCTYWWYLSMSIDTLLISQPLGI